MASEHKLVFRQFDSFLRQSSEHGAKSRLKLVVFRLRTIYVQLPVLVDRQICNAHFEHSPECDRVWKPEKYFRTIYTSMCCESAVVDHTSSHKHTIVISLPSQVPVQN